MKAGLIRTFSVVARVLVIVCPGLPPASAQTALPATAVAPPPPVPTAPAVPGTAQPAPTDATPPATFVSAASDYVLAPDDVISMSIFREPDLVTQSQISSDGTVQLPLLGDVKVGGQTVRDARALVTRLYDADYLVRPQVYLNVLQYAKLKVTVLGQVASPGTYEFTGNDQPTLLEAIALAGGFTRIANRGRISVKRAEGRGESIQLNAKDLDSPRGGAFQVKPGDIISVSESWF